MKLPKRRIPYETGTRPFIFGAYYSAQLFIHGRTDQLPHKNTPTQRKILTKRTSSVTEATSSIPTSIRERVTVAPIHATCVPACSQTSHLLRVLGSHLCHRFSRFLRRFWDRHVHLTLALGAGVEAHATLPHGILDRLCHLFSIKGE